MVTNISHSPAETEALGAACGARAREGCLFAVSGDLGAGKTQWVKGLARGMGIAERVHSPTFSIVNEYSAGPHAPLFHIDLYRLEQRQQIVNAGLEEYLRPAGVTVIEWPERWFRPEESPPGTIWVRIEILSESERKISYEGPGY